MSVPLHQQTLSLDHKAFVHTLAATQNLLIIQDLDGVCMGLVNDPLTRKIAADYISATQAFGEHFYVLTNGEHTGGRGVNRIVEQSFAQDTTALQVQQKYLPGLAAGGVQWQSRDGMTTHPGVSEAELRFLKTVPEKMEACLREFFSQHACPPALAQNLDGYLAATILDNTASPTINLNSLYSALAKDNELFVRMQKELQSHLEDLLAQAAAQGLGDSFFIHYAPNLGRDRTGQEIVWQAKPGESGTTDFQFMLRGAIKEAGVLALLNRYYFQQTQRYPLGETFNARQAPHALTELVALAADNFDPAHMPLIVGVGDTVTAQDQGQGLIQRGGSDRNFLQLIQNLNQPFNSENLTVYIDSSGGELKNRKPLELKSIDGRQHVISGPGDAADPLRLTVAFPGGYEQYCEAFINASTKRRR